MTAIDKIRNELTDNDQQVIDAVWDYHVEKRKCIPSTELARRFGRDTLISVFRSLNGSILYEDAGDGVKRCCLTFLGALLAKEGKQGEDLLRQLLEYVQSSLHSDPEFDRIESETVKDVLNLSDEQVRILSEYFWLSRFGGGGGGNMDRWSFSVPYYLKNELPLETDIQGFLQSYSLKGYDAKLPVVQEERNQYAAQKSRLVVTKHVFYSWQSDLANATNRGFIGKALEDAAKSIREDGTILVEPVVDRDTVGVPGSPDIADTILDKIDRCDVFVCDVSIINQGAPRPAPNPNVLIELGYALKVLGPESIIMILNSAYGGPELLPFDLRMRRVIPYEMPEDSEERAPERKKLQRGLAEGLRTIFGGTHEQMPGEIIQPQPGAQEISVTSFLTAGDSEFESYVTKLLTTNNRAEFNVVIEKLREAVVTVWTRVDRQTSEEVAQDQILSIKEEAFLPALRKLVFLGLLLIKYKGPLDWFNSIADLLEEIFLSSIALATRVPEALRRRQANTLGELANHTVPAVESLMAAYLLGGYEVSQRKGGTYAGALFPRVVDVVGDPSYPSQTFYLFWPVETGMWQPQRDLWVLDRYGKDSAIKSIVGGDEAIKTAILQFDCVVDWHSFVGTDQSKEPDIAKFFHDAFPNVSLSFAPSFTYEPFTFIYSFIEQLLRSIKDGSKGFFVLEPKLALRLKEMERERREHLFARFLIYADKTRRSWMLSENKLARPQYWPAEIQEVLTAVRTMDGINQ